MRSPLRRAAPVLHMLSAVFMLWRVLSLVMNTPYPVHVVISESMEPAFQRGDVVFVSNRTEEVRVGDIPVVWFVGAPLPMVHRAVRVVWGSRPAGHGRGPQLVAAREQLVLTKGDNSPIDDVVLYPPGQQYVYREQIVGLVRGYVPFVGWVSIFLNEAPYVKFGLIAGLSLISMLV